MKHKSDESSSSYCIVPNGCLVIIGGAEKKGQDKEQEEKKAIDPSGSILAEFIRCCKGDHPRIELITTASDEETEDTFKEYEQVFKECGAAEVGHIHHNNREEGNEESLQKRIKNADGVFFAGGDQLKLTSIYGGTPFLTQLKKSYMSDGLTIGGTSAGAMALSTPMIFGGTGDLEMIAAGVKIATGFEFLKDVCIDTHFVHRGRFVRMAQVVATNPASIGIGIEEDTAIIINNGLEGRVFGSGVVIIIDGVKSRGTNIVQYDENKKLTIRDLDVSILAAGELFEIPQRNPPHH